MKLVAQADSNDYRRTFLDWNRLIKITDRRFHCTWEELRGARAWITPRVARECLSRGDPENLERTRREAVTICENEATRALARRDAAQDIWWIDEWLSTSGIVGLAVLDEHMDEVRTKLLETIPPRLFHTENQETLEATPDARIVAEVVACGAELLLSSNFNTVEIHELNEWLHKSGYATRRDGSGPIHVVDNYVHECMESTEQGRRLGLKAVLAGFWPEDRNCDVDEVRASAMEAIARMQTKGAHLNQTGSYLSEKLTDWRWKTWIDATINEMREEAGQRVRQAERRHPKHKAWQKKPYGDNTPELAGRLAELRMRWPEGRIRYQVCEEVKTYGLGWLTKDKGEVLQIGHAADATVVAEVLAICGMESERKVDEKAGGIAQGRAMFLEQNRARGREWSR